VVQPPLIYAIVTKHGVEMIDNIDKA
jgi:hypothetical protein